MIVDVKDVEFGYQRASTIKDITFSVDKGDILTILGPNGVGKTTLLKCLNRVLSHRNGTILLDEKPLESYSKREIAKKIGYVAQRGSLSGMTVFDSILLGRKPHIKWDASDRDLTITAKVIDLMGLEQLSLRKINEISGGEYQMVQIARALVQQPQVILLDEPTSNLDLKNQHVIMSIIQKIVTLKDMAAIMAVHDLNQAIRYSNKFLIMNHGKFLAAGGREIITPEIIKEVYEIDVLIEEVNGVPMVLPLE
jgi:iron complex transport system ATP-binding protein